MKTICSECTHYSKNDFNSKCRHPFMERDFTTNRVSGKKMYYIIAKPHMEVLLSKADEEVLPKKIYVDRFPSCSSVNNGECGECEGWTKANPFVQLYNNMDSGAFIVITFLILITAGTGVMLFLQ